MKKDVKRLLTSELLVVFLLSSLGGEVVSNFGWVVLVLVGWFWGWAILKRGWREMMRIRRRWSDFKMGEYHLIDFLFRSREGVPLPEMKRELIAKASLNWSLGSESSCISISTSLLSRVAPREDSSQSIMDSRGRDIVPPAGHGASTAAGKILLVEDIEINRILLRKLFQDLNFLLEEAENGQIAVDYFKQGKSYDLVLMDKEMPVMDGHEATRQLRSLGVKTPIIALTGNSLQSDKDMFFQAGADEFRSKPLSRAELVRLLARYVGLESPRQQ